MVEDGVFIEIIHRNAMVLSFHFHLHLIQLDNWFSVVKFRCVPRKFVGEIESRVHRLCQSINLIQFDATQTHAIVRRCDWLRLNANNSTAGIGFGPQQQAHCALQQQFCMTQGFVQIYLSFISLSLYVNINVCVHNIGFDTWFFACD